jgi:serine/threonine-protein kinase SRPK3
MGCDKVQDCDSVSPELQTLQFLQDKCASKYTVRLLDQFSHDGPNEKHQCLVFELLGPTVEQVITGNYQSVYRFPVEDILKLAKQLLQAVASVHMAGFEHGGISGFPT